MKKKLSKLIEKNGFLLFLFICVCLVAASTIFIATRDLQKSSQNLDNKDLVILEEEDLTKEEDISGDVVASEVAQSIDDLKDKEIVESLEEDYDLVLGEIEEDEVEDDLEFVEEVFKEPSFIMPVEGETITEFTRDNLVYSSTLDEWRGHSGIDIKADVGTSVKAPSDGTIKEVYEDNLWGLVIVIDHGSGLESRLMNLGTLEMVRVGLNVKRGDYISKVGKSADIEMMMDDHIHFETRKDGKLVDPRSINR